MKPLSPTSSLGPASAPAPASAGIRVLRAHVLARLRTRTSLQRNALWLMGTTLLNAGLGYGYWIVVARRFAPADVGVATALISLMTIVSLASNLGTGSALVQRLPHRRTAEEWSTTVTASLVSGIVLGAVAAALVLLALPALAPRLAVAERVPALAALFVLGTSAWTASTVLDYAAIAERASRWTTARGAVLGVVKLPLVLLLPVGLVAGGGTTAIFASWTIACVLSCALGLVVALPRMRPGARPRPRLRGAVTELRAIRGLLVGNHLTTLGNVLPAYLLPVVVVTRLSAVAGAHFSIAWAVGTVFFTISSATGSALFAEASHAPGELRARVLGAARLTALLLTPAMLATLLAGHWILGLFGPGYADATRLLVVLTVAAVPDAITNLYVPVLRVRGRLRAAASLTLGMAAVALGGSWAFSPRWGLTGVGVLWLGSQVLGSAWVAWDARRAITREVVRFARAGAVSASAALEQGAIRIRDLRGARRKRAAARPDPGPSWAGGYALVVALALVGLALIDDAARSGSGWAPSAFWAPVVAIFLPAAVRLCGSSASAGERLRICVALGLGLYAVKVLHSPDGFTFHDELVTRRTVSDLQASGHLLMPNPVVSAYPLYPGVELVALAVKQVSGLSLYVSGLVVIGAARLVLTCALFRLLRQATGSERLAGIGSLIYAANPNFVFFDAQFAYESFALPLAVATLALVAVASDTPRGAGRRRVTACAVVTGAAVVPTHHITSYALAGVLLLWTLLTAARRWRGRGVAIAPLLIATSTTFAAAGAWYAEVGARTGGYLGPVLGGALSGTWDFLTGAGGGKAPFQSTGAAANTRIEQLLAYLSVAVLLGLLLAGLWRLRRRRPSGALDATLVALAVLYPATLALRLTQAGAETSNRASEFVFVGLAVLAGGVLAALGARRRWRLLVPAVLAVVFAGGVVVGWAPSSRVPGRPLVDADPRSVEPYSQAAARWAAQWLPQRSRIVGDRANALLMASYAGLDPVVGRSGGLHVADAITAPTVGSGVRSILTGDAIRFVVADRRLSTERPVVGYYVDRSEPRAFRYRRPIPAAAVEKFGPQAGLLRIYDDGEVSVYDTALLRGTTPLTAPREDRRR